nr:hypothetical protein [uncultured Pseudomonas sp.]
MISFLAERMTFDKLFRVSDPKRVTRSFTVKGPPLEIDSYQDSIYYAYNFKSQPSTTGLRHRGYVKFFKPRHGGQKPLQHLECLVDCTCPDFKYRWAWANKQRGSGRVGTQSLNQALNRAPRHTNPKSKPGLCKHILATREYIYGLLSSFPSDRADTADKLNQLTRFAQRRWINMPGEMEKARERDARIAAARMARNRGELAPDAAPELRIEPQNEPGDEFRDVEPPDLDDVGVPEPVEEPIDLQTSYAARVPSPGARGRTMPTAPARPAEAPKPKKSVRRIRKSTPAAPPNKAAERAAGAGFETPAEYNFRRRQGLGDSLVHNLTMTSVVNPNGIKTNMNSLTEAQKIIREMEEEEIKFQDQEGGGDVALEEPPMGGPGGPDAGGSEFGGDAGLDMPGAEGAGLDLPPSEPPMSDSAVGADTEGNVVLGLLGDIRNFLAQLASALVPEPETEEGAEGGEGPVGDFGGEEGGEGEGDGIPVEDPSEEASAEEAGAGDEEVEEEEEVVEEKD